MTTQRPDTFIADGLEYDILERKGTALFGLRHLMQWKLSHWINASNSGPVICGYAIQNERFSLVELIVGAGETVAIEGIAPMVLDRHYAIYRGLAIATEFTGKFLAARDFIPELHLPSGPLRHFSFKTVHEYHFEDGRLLRQADCSSKMEDIRQFLEADKISNANQFSTELAEIAELRRRLDAKLASLPRDPKLSKGTISLAEIASIEAERAAIKAEMEPIKTRLQALLAIVHPPDSYKMRASEIDEIFPW